MKIGTVLRGRRLCVASAVVIAVLGLADWATGYELHFFVFYLIPIAVVAWLCGRTRAYAMALLSGVVWQAADWLSGHPYSRLVFPLWNTAIRLVSFLIVAYAVARIRDLLAEERRISSDLEKALSEVKTLTGLLPICAGCKKIRNDKGYWQQIEEYLEGHTYAHFTHGLCQECAGKALREAGSDDRLAEQPAGSRERKSCGKRDASADA